MEGAKLARKERWELALFTAYHAGLFAQVDFKRMPSFAALIAEKTPKSDAEIAAWFAARADSGRSALEDT